MSNTTVSESVARPVRTAAQMAPSFALVLLIDETVYDFSDAAFGALVVLVGVVFGFIQNALEDRQGQGWFLRKVPEPDVPVEGA